MSSCRTFRASPACHASNYASAFDVPHHAYTLPQGQVIQALASNPPCDPAAFRALSKVGTFKAASTACVFSNGSFRALNKAVLSRRALRSAFRAAAVLAATEGEAGIRWRSSSPSEMSNCRCLETDSSAEPRPEVGCEPCKAEFMSLILSFGTRAAN